ncbi:MAG: hypothetical protein ABI389_13520 [Rhodanobacter sp.]
MAASVGDETPAHGWRLWPTLWFRHLRARLDGQRQRHCGASDIYLMLEPDGLTHVDVMPALDLLIDRMGREIHPTLCTRDELHKRIAAATAS